jgi:hypothetical protein
MKILTTRKNHETTIHGERFSSRAAAEKFVTALASSGRIDELVSIEDEAGPDFLETLRGMHTDELSLPYDDRKERTINELKACVSLVRAMRGMQTRVNMHNVLLDVVKTCPIGSPEAKELYEAAEALLPSDEEG